MNDCKWNHSICIIVRKKGGWKKGLTSAVEYSSDMILFA